MITFHNNIFPLNCFILSYAIAVSAAVVFKALFAKC